MTFEVAEICPRVECEKRRELSRAELETRSRFGSRHTRPLLDISRLMDYEPAFAPHPSYQLEDSSDESDWDEDATSKIKSKDELAREPRVHLEGRTDALVKGRTVVYLVGEAGERMAQAVKVESDQQLIQIHVEAQQV